MSIAITDFTEDPAVLEMIAALKQDGVHQREFSDLLDPLGHQYVDLVLEGGGVLGIALLGFTYTLEQMGIRFFSIAGTSAGAISALILAAHGGVGSKKTEVALGKLVNKDLYEVVDGPPAARRLINRVFAGAGLLGLLIPFLRIRRRFFSRLGLNPGEDFYQWIADVLQHEGVSTTAALNARMTPPENLVIRPERVEGRNRKLEARLVVIATELSTETRVLFPEMAPLFWAEPQRVNPSNYVRASMSVPIFFEPLRIDLPDDSDGTLKALWEKEVDYHGPLPRQGVFVDGGVVSNFPIDVFHDPQNVPRFPTFGVKLGDDRNKRNAVNTLMGYVIAMFESARHVLDYQFLWRNPDYSHLISKIDTGKVNWLNFAISKEEMQLLFRNGVKAADAFLREFDWMVYKEVRAKAIGKTMEEIHGAEQIAKWREAQAAQKA
jgi:NTE family protein